MWDLPGSGLEPMSPALAGGFLTTAPPGKPYVLFLLSFLPILFHCLWPTQVEGFNSQDYDAEIWFNLIYGSCMYIFNIHIWGGREKK